MLNFRLTKDRGSWNSSWPKEGFTQVVSNENRRADQVGWTTQTLCAELGDLQKCFHRRGRFPVFTLAMSTPLCLFDDNILASLIV